MCLGNRSVFCVVLCVIYVVQAESPGDTSPCYMQNETRLDRDQGPLRLKLLIFPPVRKRRWWYTGY